jgi:hypothetical protein
MSLGGLSTAPVAKDRLSSLNSEMFKLQGSDSAWLLSNFSRIINRQLDEKTAHLTSWRTASCRESGILRLGTLLAPHCG